MSKQVIHACTKERELGIMSEKINNIDQKTERIEQKIDNFIDTADKKYATKEEVQQLRVENIRQDKEINFTKSKIINLAKEVGIVTAILAIIAKQFGLY